MVIGVCELDLFIAASASLKEKRFVVKSIKDSVRHRFNVSIAEVGYLDKWQRSAIGMSVVVQEPQRVQEIFDEILRFIESKGTAEIVRQDIRILG